MIAKKYLKKDTTLLGRPRCPFPLYEFPAIFQGGIVQLSYSFSAGLQLPKIGIHIS